MSNKAEKLRMARVAAMGCIVCSNNGYEDTPAEVQHILDYDNRTRVDMLTIPLCTIHHRSGLLKKNTSGLTGWERWAEVGYHQSVEEFENRYGNQRDLLAQVNSLLG